MRHHILLIALAVLLLVTVPALGQDVLPKNLHMFAPTTDGSGMVVTYGSEYLGTLHLAYGAYVDEAIAPLDYKNPNGQRTSLIQHQLGAQIYLATGITDYANIGLAFPYIITRALDENYGISGEDLEDVQTETSTFEDLRLDAKLLLLQRNRHCIGVGLINTVTITMYSQDNFASDKTITLAPRLLFDIGRNRWTWAFNGGYKYYVAKPPEEDKPFLLNNLEIDDELVFNTGFKIRFAYDQELMLDSAVKTLVSQPFSNREADYAEVMAAYRKYWVRLNYNAVTLGASAGLTQGVGTPFVRMFIGFGRDEARLGYLTR